MLFEMKMVGFVSRGAPCCVCAVVEGTEMGLSDSIPCCAALCPSGGRWVPRWG